MIALCETDKLLPGHVVQSRVSAWWGQSSAFHLFVVVVVVVVVLSSHGKKS